MVGSSIICVDLIVRRIPGKRNFKIQDSNAFMSSSLSLSFGVMVSSAYMGVEVHWLILVLSYSRPCIASYPQQRITFKKVAYLLKPRPTPLRGVSSAGLLASR